MCVSRRITREDAQLIVSRNDLSDRKLVLKLMKSKVAANISFLRELINDYRARAFQDGKSLRQRVKLWIAVAVQALKTGARIAFIAFRHLCGAIVPALILCA